MKAKLLILVMVLVLTGCSAPRQGLDRYPAKEEKGGVHAVYKGYKEPARPSPYSLGDYLEKKMAEGEFQEKRTYALQGCQRVSEGFMAASGRALRASGMIGSASLPSSFSIDTGSGLAAAQARAESSLSDAMEKGMRELEQRKKKE